MVATTRQMLQNLCKSIVTRLQNRKAISCPAQERQEIEQELFSLLGEAILTDEDLHARTLKKIGTNADALSDTGLTESTQYRTARSLVRKSFGDDELNGFYFQKSLKVIAQQMAGYLMDSPRVEEVYETDEDLEQMIVDIVKRFNPNHAQA